MNRAPRTRARALTAAATCATLSVALGAASPARAEPTPSRTVRLNESGQARRGDMAPPFAAFALDGSEVLSLDKLRAAHRGAPVLLTFGASWCSACEKGLPKLLHFAQAHPALQLVLVDVESDGEAALKFATRLGVTGPALLDKFAVIARAYGASGDDKTSLPRTFLLDGRGRVRAIYREEGDDLESVLQADLEGLPKAAPPGVGPQGNATQATAPAQPATAKGN